jgi:hypothetical protein
MVATKRRSIDANALNRACAFDEGAETPWSSPNGENGCLRAALGRILIMGDREQSIEFDWLPFVNGRHVRPRFFCPACARGSQDIAEYPSRLNGRRPLGPSCCPVPDCPGGLISDVAIGALLFPANRLLDHAKFSKRERFRGKRAISCSSCKR